LEQIQINYLQKNGTPSPASVRNTEKEMKQGGEKKEMYSISAKMLDL
jgi:hypothetical protein